MIINDIIVFAAGVMFGLVIANIIKHTKWKK